MRRTMRQRGSALALFASVAVAAAACGGSSGGSSGGGSGGNKASAPGVTADSVLIGTHTPLTGVAAPGYSQIAPASEAYFKYVNDNGGINGRKITYSYKDDVYNPTNTANVVRQLVLQDKVYAMLGGLGTPTHSAVIDFLNTSKVPDLFVESGALTWNQPKKYPYTFGWQPDYETEGKILGQYAKQNFAGKKIGLFLQNDDFGENGEKGVDYFIKDQIVTRQRYQSGNTDVGPQMAALQAAGAEVIIGFMTPSYTALTLLGGLKLGYKPQWLDSSVAVEPQVLDAALQRFSKGAAGGSLLENTITLNYLPDVSDMNDPWTQLFKKVHDKYIPSAPFSSYTMYGMATAYTFAQALKAAGQNPTRESLIKAVESNKFNPNPGLVPFRFSKDDHSGYNGAVVVKVEGGKLKELSKVFTTDHGSSAPKENTKVNDKPPANGLPG
ncbi:MAG: ABC transporter substrate-binding protein [Mycobacteriales bacterium]